MDFIFSRTKPDKQWESFFIGEFYLNYLCNNAISDREIIFESQDHLIIGDVNIAFKNSINNYNDPEGIKKNIEKLTNGFVIIANKSKGTVTFFTDIFGYYQLFYIKKDKGIVVASDFKFLLRESDKEVDEMAVLDLVLFNYTLLDRTLIHDIKRIKGGSELNISNGSYSFEVKNNFADNFVSTGKSKSLKPVELGEILKKNLEENLCPDYENQLTMTGGFDSRALLAASIKLGLEFNSFTFGQKGNIEIETPKPFIHQYSKSHKIFELDQKYVQELPETLVDFIGVNLDNPTILDLPQYSLIRKQLAPSNIITGFMGGEIMAGQSIGSQVTFTKFASDLIMAGNSVEFGLLFDNAVKDTGLFNLDQVNHIKDEYLFSLKGYFQQPYNQNLMRFLINEKYAKFFGTVNKVFRNHCNLVTPFMDDVYITSLLNSQISFLRKKPFYQNPLNNLKYKIFYAGVVRNLSPELGETKLDRLYKVNDLCKWYRIPKAGIGYVRSHVFKMNKTPFPRPHHYDLWYKEIILSKLDSEPIEIFNFHPVTNDAYEKLNPIQQKRLANATAVCMALEAIK